LIKDKETIDTCAATGSAGECAASKRPRVGPKDRNKSADLTGVAAYDHISPGTLHVLTEVRQDVITIVGGSGGEHELEMAEQLLGKKNSDDIAPAEETPASSSYSKDKEGRKNESTVNAEPKPASPAAAATEALPAARPPARESPSCKGT
jgi:hypothetical protein